MDCPRRPSLIVLPALLAAALLMAGTVGGQPVNKDRLLRIASRSAVNARSSKVAAETLAVRTGFPLVSSPDTSISVRAWVALRNGRPVIYETHNRKAARSVRISALLDAGERGLSLTGESQRIGLWDAGGVRTDHIEFGGRVSRRDAVEGVQSHATHVAGTLAASGAWRPVRGMAPRARVQAYDWNNEVAEMAIAAANGLRVSSHSYGVSAGWVENLRGDGRWAWLGDPQRDPKRDSRYGLYDEQARSWDEICHAAPEYVIVKSAGNERGDRGPDPGEPYYIFRNEWELSTEPRPPDAGADGYETILDAGTAKNILTIGAVEQAIGENRTSEAIRMTAFSGWGPTDDGRIKPDLVAGGVSVLSSMAWSAEAYGLSSGTSQATPVIAGGIALLNELYEQINTGKALTSAQMKGLLIHTADDGDGRPGPDYRTGWGLANFSRAAALIRAESSASPGALPMLASAVVTDSDLYELTISTRGIDLLRVTVVWTDPPGTIQRLTDDRSPRLVNDVNLSVVTDDGEVLPWVLDPASPFRPASRGKNRVDNVEQVVTPSSGSRAIIRLSAAGRLAQGRQRVAIIASDAASSAPPASRSISGVVRMGNTPVPGVRIRISGPEHRGVRTFEDGRFLLDDLSPGRYRITAESDILQFPDMPVSLDLPSSEGPIEIQAEPPISIDDVLLFQSPELLQSDESEFRTRVSSPAAGGVYGVRLFFHDRQGPNLEGARLEIDTEYDPYVAPYIGDYALGRLEASSDQTLYRFHDGRYTKRIPAIWTDAATPPGTVVRIPFKVFSTDNSFALADTIRLDIEVGDNQAPIPVPRARFGGRGVTPPGEVSGIHVSFLDGADIAHAEAILVDRWQPDAVLYRRPLRDSGNLGNDHDNVQGDGQYSARFMPAIEADYRLMVRAVDGYGNEATSMTDKTLSSRPFSKSADILLVAFSERHSATESQAAALAAAGLEYDIWEEWERGPVSPDLLARYDYVVWKMGGVGSLVEDDIDQIDELISKGTPVLLLVGRRSPSLLDGWLSRHVSAEFDRETSMAGEVTGARHLESMAGFKAALSETPLLLSGPSAASRTVLMSSGSGAVTVSAPRLIVSTLDASLFRQAPMAGGFFARSLFHLSNGGLLPAPPPAPPGLSVRLSDHAPEPVTIEWAPLPFATYEVQVVRAEDPDAVVAHESRIPKPSTHIDGLDAGSRFNVRVRGVNPGGTGDWSSTVTFETPEPNRRPVSTPIPALTLGAGARATDIDLLAYFSDPDGDELAFSAHSDAPAVATVSTTGSTLRISPLSAGTATAEVSARDPAGDQVSVGIGLTVLPNSPPIALSGTENITVLISAGVHTVSLAGMFDDNDGDRISYSAHATDTSIVRVEVTNTDLLLYPRLTGKTTLRIKADDGRGGRARLSTHVTVRTNQPPAAIRPDPSVDLLLADSTASVPVSDLFSDGDGDLLRLISGTPSFAIGAAWRQIALPEGGVLAMRVRNGRLEFRANETGSYSLVLRASDGFAESEQLRLRVRIRAAVSLATIDTAVPDRFKLRSIYPNPVRERARLLIDIPSATHLTIDQYGLDGKHIMRIADEAVRAGSHRLSWIQPAVPSGMYILVAHGAGGSDSIAFVWLR